MRFKLSRQAQWLLLTLGLITVALFLTGRSNSFVNWDDEQNFLRNAGLRLGLWDHLRWAWGTGLLGVFQPFAWHLLWLQTHFSGGSAHLFHTVSALLHGAITCGVFAFTMRFASQNGTAQRPALLFWASLGTLFFALHPLRTEVVAWASCQPYLWSVAFGMLAFWFYWNACESSGKSKQRAARWAAIFFLAALLCKVILFCLPAVLWIFHRRSLKQTWKSDWFYWVTAAAILVLALSHRDIRTQLRQDQIGPGIVFWLTPFIVATEFLSKTALPIGLSAFYPLSTAGNGVFDLVVVIIGLIFLFSARRREWWQFAGVVGVLLLPGVTAAMTERIAFADRYAYLPAMGASIALAPWMAARFAQSSSVLALASAVCLGLATLTLDAIAVWRNSDSLWRHAIEVGHESGKSWANRGTALLELRDIAQAEQAFRNSLRFDPNLAEAHNGLGLCFAQRGDWSSARRELEAALAQRPAYPEAINNLAFVMNGLNQPDAALAIVDRALVLDSNNARIHENRARILDRLGRVEESIAEFRLVVQSDPQDPESHSLLGTQFLKAKRAPEAAESFAQAVALNPSQVQTRYSLALALKSAGRLNEARQALRGLLAIAPAYQPAEALMSELSIDSQAPKHPIVQ